MRPHRISLPAAVVALVVLSVTAALAAGPWTPQLRYTAADQRLARSVVLKRAELPDLGATWTGGFVEPTVEADPCLGAKQSDLVLTGAAETVFESEYAWVDSNVWVLRTAEMVRLDGSRQPSAVVERRCLRASYDEDMRVRSVSRLPFAVPGARTSALRVTYDLVTEEGTTRQIDDTITVFVDRYELSLWVTTHAGNTALANALERSSIGRMVRRVMPVKPLGVGA